jgi:hypothetical protein
VAGGGFLRVGERDIGDGGPRALGDIAIDDRGPDAARRR